MKILIVDDEYVSLKKLELYLSHYGRCDAATNGNQAIELFEKGHATLEPYSVITMDIDMPGTKGPEVVRRIREWESFLKQGRVIKPVKIIMVSGKRDKYNVVSSLKKGAERYLAKPFRKEDIERLMLEFGFNPMK